MADIILKGRDMSGNLVDNVYTGINTMSVKNSSGEDIKFFNRPFDNMGSYYMQTVRGDDGKNYFTPVDSFTAFRGPYGAYAYMTGEDFDKYKIEGSFGGQVMVALTLKRLELGKLYTFEDILLNGGE